MGRKTGRVGDDLVGDFGRRREKWLGDEDELLARGREGWAVGGARGELLVGSKKGLGGSENEEGRWLRVVGWIRFGRIPRAKGVGLVAAEGMEGWDKAPRI